LFIDSIDFVVWFFLLLAFRFLPGLTSFAQLLLVGVLSCNQLPFIISLFISFVSSMCVFFELLSYFGSFSKRDKKTLPPFSLLPVFPLFCS
jgi:hypothetical protein